MRRVGPAPRRRGPWGTASASDARGAVRRPLVIALGCAGLLVVAAAGLVVLYWGPVSRFASDATTMWKDLTSVRAAVAAACGTQDVHVKHRVSNGVPSPCLEIEVVNAPGLRDLGDDAARGKALEIATLARDTLGADSPYVAFDVVWTSRVGAGVTLSSRRNFVFRTEELPSATSGTGR